MRILSAGLLGLMALSLGCSAGRSFPSQPAPQAAEARRGRARVEIDNQNFSAMKVYMMDAGSRVYIGIAPGLSRTSLVIPGGASRTSSELRLLADPIGGASPITTEDLFVAPQQNVFWTIGSFPSNSFVSAR